MRKCIYCHQVEGEASSKCNMRQPEGGAHFFETIAARVEPKSRDRFTLSLSPGYRAVWFKLANGGVEIVILDTQATETTRLAVAPPKVDQTLRVHMPDPDQVEIIYEGKK
jgi:hypothetical protein